MQVHPYLNFNGQCEAAFKFYAECLGGKLESMFPYAGTPGAEQVSADWQKKIMHARLNVDGCIIMGSDAPPSHFDKPQGFAVSLNFKDPAQAERAFHALEKNGTVRMPIQETFWAARFGMLVDQFGIPWMINCEPATPMK
jgi:PhnB protein